MRINRLLAGFALFATSIGAILGVPVSAEQPITWSPSPDVTWDVTNADPAVRHTGPVRALVWDLQEHDGAMYVAGKFLNVKAPDGTTRDQAYLAAFDLDSGAWIDSFRPQIDGAVYAIDIAPNGRIVAGGELSGGVGAFDIITGARDNTFNPGITNSWGPPAVFDVEVSGGDIFVGGTFTASQGVALSNLAKLDAGSGVIDTSWVPKADFDTGTPVLAGRRVYALAVDESRGRVYAVGKFGGINGDDTASYFATLDINSGAVRADVPQGLPRFIPNHRESFSMWMQDVQWRDDKIYIGGQGHQTIIMDAATLTAEHSYYSNRGVGDQFAGGDTQAIFLGKNTVWSGCHCWGSTGEFQLGSYIADPGGLQTFAEYSQWAVDFRTINPFGQQKTKGGYGVDIATAELVPLTFNVGGQAGAYAIYEDSNDRVWFGGQFQRDSVTGRVIEGIARFSPTNLARPGPTGLRSTLQTKERIVLNWDRMPDADHYDIIRLGAVVGSRTGVWFTEVGLSPGVEYSYTVRAVMADGTVTAESPELVVSTKGQALSNVPTGLRSTLQTRERIVINWQAFPDARIYEIARDDFIIATRSGVWFTNLALFADTEYRYNVRAVLHDGSRTGWSDPLVVSTNP